MKTIYKYVYPIQDRFTAHMPRGAEILHVECEYMVGLTFWALVDTGMQNEERVFEVRGTGHPADGVDSRDHLATVISGGFVWHVFEPGRGLMNEGEVS